MQEEVNTAGGFSFGEALRDRRVLFALAAVAIVVAASAGAVYASQSSVTVSDNTPLAQGLTVDFHDGGATITDVFTMPAISITDGKPSQTEFDLDGPDSFYMTGADSKTTGCVRIYASLDNSFGWIGIEMITATVDGTDYDFGKYSPSTGPPVSGQVTQAPISASFQTEIPLKITVKLKESTGLTESADLAKAYDLSTLKITIRAGYTDPLD